jgi:molybdate transport system substrate-binding protein
MKSFLSVLTALCALGFITFQSPARAQEKIKVLSDNPLEPALIEIGKAFRRDSGHQVEFVFGLSPVIHKKVTDGEVADVLIIQPNFVAELIKSGKVVSGDHPIIGRVGIGIFTRADAPARDISTVEAFRQDLLNADTLLFNTVASGDQFAMVLERLKIAEAVKAKVIRLPPGPVFYERIVQGKGNDLGVGQIPSILATKGVKLLGPLPPEVEIYIVYTAAPLTSAQSPEAGKAFIRFLTSPAAKAAFTAVGVE